MTTRTHCRACGGRLTRTLVDLGSTPLANSYLSAEDLAAGGERSFPLHARACENCFLVQVDDPVDAGDIFNADYAYFSSYSDSWLAHAKTYADGMTRRFKLGPQSLVMEVASNDGYLLQYFVEKGIPVLGVEPAANCAEAARARGVRSEVAFFGRGTGQDLAARGFKANLVAANNVLAHVPDIGDFVAGFAEVLKPEGTVTVEFPHLVRLVEGLHFDTIYHEHYSYLSLYAVERVFDSKGLRIYDVERLTTHGGSLRIFACHAQAGFEDRPGLSEVRREEAEAGVTEARFYEGFAKRVEASRASFLAFLREAKAEGRTVAAYGAAAKGNTFLNYCGVGADDIVAVFDRNPHKQGRFLPGSHIPVLPAERLEEIRPDYVVVLPWNLIDEVKAQLAFVASWGGRLVVAIPETRILE